MSTGLLELFFLDQFEPIKALKCDEAAHEEATNEAADELAEEDEGTSDSYKFVVPEEKWSSYATGANGITTSLLELGQSFEVSALCNPNFMLFETWSCEDILYHSVCTTYTSARGYVFFGQFNTNGILETPLQCPQCGCGATGAANLNELYIEEKTGSRKVSDDAKFIMLSQYE